MSHIHIFTGADTTALHIALSGYIEAYSSTYGAENVYTIDTSTADISDLERDIYSPSLFSPYRLFILRSISLVSKSKNTDTETEDIQAEIDIPENTYGVESLLEKLVDSPYPDSTIYIVSPQIDSRKKISKKITDIKNVEVHTYIYPTTPAGISSMLQSQYTDISREIITKIMSYHISTQAGTYEKVYNIPKIQSELQKIQFLQYTQKVSIDMLPDIVEVDRDTAIFAIIDGIYAGDALRTRTALHHLLESESIYPVYASLCTNLRTGMYIKYLTEIGVSIASISTRLGTKPTPMKNATNSRISYTKLRDFYISLVRADVATKSGKGIGNNELGLLFAIEREILTLKF